MEQQKTESLLERLKGVNSSEILPPLILNGIEHFIGISTNHQKNTVTISYSECLERSEEDKFKAPNYYKQERITLPMQMLSWFAPRLDGYRSYLGVENSFEKNGSK